MSAMLRSERDGDVVTLTITRDEKMNALVPSLLVEVREAMDQAVAAGARAIVWTGEGRAFSSGADLNGEGGDALPDDLGALLANAYNPLAATIADLPVPLIVAVNGAAVGAGMGFALSGDYVIAERSAYFLLAFANIGLVPDAGATWMVARAVGRARALDLALTGRKLTAEEAGAIGLIARVVDDGTALAEAQALAHRFAAGPGLALGMIRKQVAHALENDFGTSIAEEARNQSRAGRTEDFREAVAAFGEKRKPHFKGR